MCSGPSSTQRLLNTVCRDFSGGAVGEARNSSSRKLNARLKPDTANADWSKLVGSSVSNSDYADGLADRLIIVACAKAGGPNVIRGLIGNQMICPFRDQINLVLRTGRRPDGDNASMTYATKGITAWNNQSSKPGRYMDCFFNRFTTISE